MTFRKILIGSTFLLMTLFEFSCIRELGITFPSINMAKRKKKIAPSFNFNSALFSYRQKYGHWPNSELDFSSYDSKVVKDNLYQGFETWSLGRFSQDTIYIYWIHEPIADGAHVGIIPIPDKRIYLISRYTFPDRNVSTKVLRRKKFHQETGT